MILKKTILFFIVSLFSVCFCDAYLLSGLYFKVVVSLESIEKLKVFVETCSDPSPDQLKCKKSVEKNYCTNNLIEAAEATITQWDCSTKDLLPFRIGIEKSGLVIMASEKFQYSQRDTRARYAVHFAGNKIELIESPQDRIFYIGMQEMLESVFFSSEVKLIRQMDIKKGRHFFETIEKPETRFLFKVCQYEDCKKGLSQEISCNFSTMGIRGIAYECKNIPALARFAQVSLVGHDKTRNTVQFKLSRKKEEPYVNNFIIVKSNTLELSSGHSPSME